MYNPPDTLESLKKFLDISDILTYLGRHQCRIFRDFAVFCNKVTKYVETLDFHVEYVETLDFHVEYVF